MNHIRRALGPAKSESFAMSVGVQLCSFFDQWPNEGQKDLFDACHGTNTQCRLSVAGTLFPVSTELFGPEFSESNCPHLKRAIVDFDSEVAKSIYEVGFTVTTPCEDVQVPLDHPEVHVRGRAELVSAFEAALGKECNTKPDCPLGMAVYGAKPVRVLSVSTVLSSAQVPARYGKYGISNVWAAQGNTIPATFWTIAFILNSPHWKHKARPYFDACSRWQVVNEVRTHFKGQPDHGKFDLSKLPLLDACFKAAHTLLLDNCCHRRRSD